ncbi:hypothetical protein BRD13_02760 [Halobacteriales archaeon SW_5_70_135]|nr:MAG: hypothetical protein BRD13_02760 [Halobacteriales archaeon SW_5_70_135]
MVGRVASIETGYAVIEQKPSRRPTAVSVGRRVVPGGRLGVDGTATLDGVGTLPVVRPVRTRAERGIAPG